jgi:hypothetical protein
MSLTPRAIKDMQPIPSSGVLLSNLFFEVNRRLSPTLWAGDSESITGDALAALLLASGAAVNINLIQELNPRGAYSATTTYALYDFIKLSGVNYAYVGTSPSAGNAPPNTTYWTEISEDGISGNKVWFVTAAPSASLGAVDDAAIQDDGKIYKKTAPTTWTLMFDAANTADISAAITAHEGSTDPHPQYLTQAEGDTRYPLLSTFSEVIDDRVGTLFIAGTNTTPQYNDPANTLQINAVGGSSGGGGATGIQYVYNSASGATAAGEIRAADLSNATTLAINATDSQGKGASDVLARLKAGAIINLAKDSTHWVRYAVTADYATGSVAVTVAQFLGAIVSGDTMYLSIVSDAPSGTSGAGSQPLASGTISATSTASTITIASSAPASGGVLPYIYAWYKGSASGFAINSGSLISGATSASYTDTGLPASTTFYYRRVVMDGLGNKAATPELSASITVLISSAQDLFGRTGVLVGSSPDTPSTGVIYENYLSGGNSGSITGGSAQGVPGSGVGARLGGLSLGGTYTISATITPTRYLGIIARASSTATQLEGIWVSFVPGSSLIRIESTDNTFASATLGSAAATFTGNPIPVTINVTPTSVQVLVPILSINITAATSLYAANNTVGLYFDGAVGIPDSVDSWSIF